MTITAGFAGSMRRATGPLMGAACILALVGCAGVTRVPFTSQEQSIAAIPGISGARVWADDPTIGTARRVVSPLALKQPTVLALSGGGAYAAYGAGFLNGWTARGTRPQFTIVTGASSGALIAPFAFLGASQDETLRRIFTSGEMENLLQPDALKGIFGTGLYKTGPLRDLIARHVDAKLLEAIARENLAGRRLYVVTTNIDAQRTAIWDMGRIATSEDPGALDLFRNILTASASIPGLFSPVLIDVEAEGRHFAEMHVDGGVTANVLIVPEAVLLSGTPLFVSNARPKIYIVMNGKIAPEFEVVKDSALSIVTRSFETSVRANTQSTLLASYEFSKRRNWEFNLTSIDSDYPESTTSGFDTAYMRQLFEFGYQKGQNGPLWQPPQLELKGHAAARPEAPMAVTR
jgi:predicted acylesterase/phospholipase RssA